MLDPMFSFVEPFVEPVAELSEDNNCFVIPVEILLDFMQKAGRPVRKKVPEGTKIEVPLDLAISLLRPDELEKLQKYITAYLAEYPGDDVE